MAAFSSSRSRSSSLGSRGSSKCTGCTPACRRCASNWPCGRHRRPLRSVQAIRPSLRSSCNSSVPSSTLHTPRRLFTCRPSTSSHHLSLSSTSSSHSSTRSTSTSNSKLECFLRKPTSPSSLTCSKPRTLRCSSSSRSSCTSNSSSNRTSSTRCLCGASSCSCSNRGSCVRTTQATPWRRTRLRYRHARGSPGPWTSRWSRSRRNINCT
mmetsp:Transcript_11212/g.45618  ORF Transcript_11212/g.45618 Transcript_11212/m.45618 type:complete len:209 (-) Transcript_11212:685-1311(-)